MGGREVTIEWQGRSASAWVPDQLDGHSVDLTVAVVRASEQAVAEVRRVGDRMPAGWEPLARILLRAEGHASSDIEGLRAAAAAVAVAELDAAAPEPAAWVADNLAVVAEVLRAAATGQRLTEEALQLWHVRLMRHGTLPGDLVGKWRDVQGWIGGRSPRDAVFVPPSPSLVPELMTDLVAFCNRDELDAVSQAAIAHAQFETIHPYGDGNGRIGRLLVLWLLARRAQVAVPPPVSVAIARDIGGYLAGLHWFRAGELARWIGWFASVVRASAATALEWAGEVESLLAIWDERVADVRADATARRVLPLLPAHPVVTAHVVATDLGVSEASARVALHALEARGIVAKYAVARAGAGRPRQYWVARELTDLVGSWR